MRRVVSEGTKERKVGQGFTEKAKNDYAEPEQVRRFKTEAPMGRPHS